MKLVDRETEGLVYVYYKTIAHAFLMLPVGRRSYRLPLILLFYATFILYLRRDVDSGDAFPFKVTRLETQDKGPKHIYQS